MSNISNVVLADNAFGTLGAGLVVGDTTLTFTSGHGARFPAVTGSQNMYLCILNSSNLIEEVIVTAHTAGADTATMTRAAGGTTAKAWNSGDRVEVRMSSACLAAIMGTINECFAVACSDETTALTAGTTKTTFIVPYTNGFTLTGVIASLTTAQASGNIFTVDINEAGTSVLSTKLTIDNTETDSTSAAIPAVISDSSLAGYAKMTVDVDQIGNGSAAGLKIYLIGHQT